MGWKDWPSWLKGGVIGLIVSIPFTILFVLSLMQCSFTPTGVCKIILEIHNLMPYYGGYEAYILPIIFITLIGAFISWLIGKFKK
ncbi:MAG: hypothetical protein Q7S56_01270 [Nanoarchaeota archaeon]|nr:hypothetical protein [Nanoarchaeota archaeon]